MVMSEDNVWDMVVNEWKERQPKEGETTEGVDDPNVPRQTTLLFVGDRGAGKTTLLHSFLDKSDPPRPTLALEYTYGRKTGKKMDKDICHLWELGGGTVFTSLLSTPLNPHTILTLAVFLVLDLSRLDTLWTHMELLLNQIKNRIDTIVNSPCGQSLKLEKKLREKAMKRFGEYHQDIVFVSPFLVPLTIIGGKYDLFKNFEPESKRLVCRSLRFVAHINGANLIYFSSQNAKLMKATKEMISHYGFRTLESYSEEISQECNNPLFILCGSDSFESIRGSSGDYDSRNTSYDNWKQAFKARFPQEADKKSSTPVDPAKDLYFMEPDVDNLRAQKDEELDRLRKEIGRYNLKSS